MKAFKRILGTLIVLLIIIFVMAPFSIGFWVQHKNPLLLKTLETHYPQFQFAIEDYHRGFYSSEATLVMSHKGSQADIVKFDVHLQHGLVMSVQGKEGKRSFHFAWVAMHFAVKQEGSDFRGVAIEQLDGQWNIHGFGQYTFRSNKVTFSFKNAKIDLTLSPEQSKGENQFTVPYFELMLPKSKDHHSKVVAHDVEGKSQFHKADQINYGDANYSIRQLSIEGGKHPVSIDGMTWNIHAFPQQHTSTIKQLVKINDVRVAKKKYGPLSIELTFDNLNTKALNAFMKKIRQLSLSQQVGTESPAALNRVFTQGGLSLLMLGVDVNLNIRYVTGSGLVTVTGSVHSPNVGAKLNPLLILKNLQAQVHVQLPTAWAQETLTLIYTYQDKKDHSASALSAEMQAQQSIHKWIQSKTLIESGDHLQLNASYDKQHAMVNGRPLPLGGQSKGVPHSADKSAADEHSEAAPLLKEPVD